MARDFAGGAATDRLASASTFGLASSLSVSVWIWADSLDATARRAYEHSAGGQLQAYSTGVRFTRAFSTTAGNWTIAAVSTGAWVHLCWTHDGSATANDAAAYVGGSAATVTREIAPSGTVTTTAGTLYVGNGNPPGFNRCFDGRIAELAIWSGLLSAGDAAALADRVPAPAVRPDILAHYLPLWGRTSPERDYWSPRNYTVTTAAQAEHPPVPLPFGPRRPRPRLYTAPAGGSLLPLVSSIYRRRRTG